MNYSLNNNLLCEKRIQKCLHDFSMNEVIDIIRESKLIKFTDKITPTIKKIKYCMV